MCLQLLAVCLLSERQKLYLHWSHKVNTLAVIDTADLPPTRLMNLNYSKSIEKDNDMSLSDRDLAGSDVLPRSHRRLVRPVDRRVVHVTTLLPGDSSFSPLTCSVATFHFLSPDRLLFPDQVTAPFLHLGGVMLMTALAWPVASHFFRMNSRGKRLGRDLKYFNVQPVKRLQNCSEKREEVATEETSASNTVAVFLRKLA